MITAFLIFIFLGTFYLITAPLRLLSDAELPSWLSAGFDTAAGYAAALDDFLPLDILVIVIGFVILIETALFIFKLVRWVYKKIPTIS